MHQRQTAGGDQALDGAHRNTELLGGFALGQSSRPDTIAGSNPARERVKKWHVLTSSDTNCEKRRDSSNSEVRGSLTSPLSAPPPLTRYHSTGLTISLDGERMFIRWLGDGT